MIWPIKNAAKSSFRKKLVALRDPAPLKFSLGIQKLLPRGLEDLIRN